MAFALAVSATFVSLGTGALATSAGAASSNGGSNTTMVQTAAATKDLSAATWWIWYRPIASVDPVKYNDYPEDLIIPNMCESLFKELPGQKTVGNLASSYLSLIHICWPTSCSPTGSPSSVKPAGTEIEGKPVALTR